MKHTPAAEIAKRHELRAQIREELSKPLKDQLLPPAEREQIRTRVTTGKIAQSVWPGSRGGGYHHRAG